MSLNDRLRDDLTAAMRSGDALRRDTLRMVQSAAYSVEKEKRRPLTDEELVAVLGREVKTRRESVEAFRAGGREEQAASEERELEILEEFMPEPLAEEDIEDIVDDAIAEVGATSMADLGRVMADVMPQVAGRADGSVVSQIVREKLA